MIASPCRECPKMSLPKDNCMKDCDVLQAVQDIHVSSEGSNLLSAIDYSEESRFAVCLPFSESSLFL
jgi:hypothetical protein